MRRAHVTRRRLGAFALAAALLLGACASDDPEEGSSGPDGTAGDLATSVIQPGWVNPSEAAPSSGGTLEVTLPSPPGGLDPKGTPMGVMIGGAPLMAIYDSLLRWDPETDTFSGQLAESISHDEDFTVWTLKLRPGLTFTDGTPLDAEAVVYSIQRMSGGLGAVATYPGFFESFETPDPLTVVMTMKAPLNNVDALLAGDLGYVVSPTAAEADPDGFRRNPVGAGPFMLSSYNPDAEIVLVRNPGYALGDVPLDGIRFTWSSEQEANMDKLELGSTDLALVTTVDLVVDAIEAGYPTYSTLVGGSGIAINSAAGRTFPGHDPRVRQAMAMAIDIEQVNQRVNDGEGIMGPFLFAPGTRDAADTPFSTYDPEEARRLLDEVKAETGWDGTFELVTPLPNDFGLAYQAQLNAVGFNAQLDQVQTFLQLVEKTSLTRNFDAAIHVITAYETSVFQALNRTLSATSPSNYMSYSNPEMEALVAQLRSTADSEATRAVLDQIAELWQTQQPFLLTGTQPFTTVTGEGVGGLHMTVDGLILFGEAYKAS